MGSAFHQLYPRYTETITPLPLRLLGYGKLLPLPMVGFFWYLEYNKILVQTFKEYYCNRASSADNEARSIVHLIFNLLSQRNIIIIGKHNRQ